MQYKDSQNYDSADNISIQAVWLYTSIIHSASEKHYEPPFIYSIYGMWKRSETTADNDLLHIIHILPSSNVQEITDHSQTRWFSWHGLTNYQIIQAQIHKIIIHDAAVQCTHKYKSQCSALKEKNSGTAWTGNILLVSAWQKCWVG